MALAALSDPRRSYAGHDFERVRRTPSGQIVPPTNVSMVNDWLTSVTKIGVVGTDVGVNGTINDVMQGALLAEAGSLLSGIPIPPVLAPVLGAAAILSVALKVGSPDGECNEVGDYDMGLTGLVRLLYLYGPHSTGRGPLHPAIERDPYDYALDRLLHADRGSARLAHGAGDLRHPHSDPRNGEPHLDDRVVALPDESAAARPQQPDARSDPRWHRRYPPRQ